MKTMLLSMSLLALLTLAGCDRKGGTPPKPVASWSIPAAVPT